ncbi:hypothetical protein AB1Y20_006431 [Prymnesium parvum]|uniref:CS domain-containing protein n=1 Tax=Prymnesium parvum TaxID=97485 RepID=A0AB34IXZ3_PRYPA
MLTPQFDLRQDDEFVLVRIRLPYLRADEGEFYVLEHEFKFYLKPYFLRLTFRHRLVEDGRERSEYDFSTSVLTVWLPKEIHGQHFDDLHMLSELLKKPARGPGRPPLIEEVGQQSASRGSASEQDELDPGDVEVEQALPSLNLGGTAKYGFNHAYSGCFVGLDEDGELLQLREVERSTPASRRAARIQHEEEAFDVEHYAADMMLPDECDDAIAFCPWWGDLAADEGGARGDGSWFGIGSDYQQQLQQLARREILLDSAERREAMCGLVDLLFAYCYDVRTTEGEHTVESGWTICRVSSLLSFLDAFSSIRDVALASVRRSLCYPLRRHWELALRVLCDVVTLLRLGPEAVLRALLDVRRLVQAREDGHLLVRIFLDDYCIWVQQTSASSFNKLADRLAGHTPRTEEIGWTLPCREELEDANVSPTEQGEETDRSSNSSLASEDESMPCFDHA